MKLRGGDLNRRIKLRRKMGTTRDAAGGTVPAWDEIEIWSAYRSMTGKESVVGSEVKSLIDAEFWIRFGPAVTAKHEIVFDGRTFDIFNYSEIGFREGWKIQATERRAGAQ